MELEEIYSQNRVALKKIKKQSTTSCVLCGLFLCMILFELYYAVMISPIFVLLAVIAAAVSVTGFIGITKNDNHWSTASLILLAVHLLVFTALISDSLSDVVVALVMSGSGHGVFAYFTYRTMQSNRQRISFFFMATSDNGAVIQRFVRYIYYIEVRVGFQGVTPQKFI